MRSRRVRPGAEGRFSTPEILSAGFRVFRVDLPNPGDWEWKAKFSRNKS